MITVSLQLTIQPPSIYDRVCINHYYHRIPCEQRRQLLKGSPLELATEQQLLQLTESHGCQDQQQ